MGIDPNVFEVELISEEKTFFGLFTDKKNPETKLRIKNTNYFFFFRTRNTSGNTYCNINLSFSPDKELRSNKVDFSTAKKKYQWKMVFKWYVYWLECLQDELTAKGFSYKNIVMELSADYEQLKEGIWELKR